MSARSGAVLCVVAVLARCMHMASGHYVLVYGVILAAMVGWVSPLVCTADKYRIGICIQSLHWMVDSS